MLAIYRLNYSSAPPIKINIEVNEFVIPMEVKRSASASLWNLQSILQRIYKVRFIISLSAIGTTATYHPLSNGPAEKAVQTFKSSMEKTFKNSNSNLITSINRFLLSYFSTRYSFTLLSPTELLFNCKIRTCLSLLKPRINKIKDEEERLLVSLKNSNKDPVILPWWPSLGHKY